VKDNDFTEWIEEFAKDMAVTGIYLKRAKAGLATLEEQREMICDIDRFRELFYNTDNFDSYFVVCFGKRGVEDVAPYKTTFPRFAIHLNIKKVC
jgi:hypothetical protein